MNAKSAQLKFVGIVSLAHHCFIFVQLNELCCGIMKHLVI